MIIQLLGAISLAEYVEAESADGTEGVRKPDNCPRCGARDCFWRHGRYQRTVIEGSQERKISVTRLICKSCGLTVSLLQSFIVPYRQFSAAAISQAVEVYVDGTAGSYLEAADRVSSAEEEIEINLPIIQEWLAKRGLSMNPEKTSIQCMDEGFDFLGFNLRHYRGVCLIMPQKEKVLEFLANIRSWLKVNKQAEAAVVIGRLNPVISGWANYYKGVVSKETFSYVKSQIWQQLWRWCLRRHAHKQRTWVKRKYFTECGNKDWVFHAITRTNDGHRKNLYLRDISETPIIRHIKVRGTHA